MQYKLQNTIIGCFKITLCKNNSFGDGNTRTQSEFQSEISEEYDKSAGKLQELRDRILELKKGVVAVEVSQEANNVAMKFYWSPRSQVQISE